MEKKKPSGVCGECGIAANVLTCLKKYGAPPKQLCFSVSTSHKGVCAYCRKTKMVTEERDYFYPDFSLIGKIVKFFKEGAKDV